MKAYLWTMVVFQLILGGLLNKDMVTRLIGCGFGLWALYLVAGLEGWLK